MTGLGPAAGFFVRVAYFAFSLIGTSMWRLSWTVVELATYGWLPSAYGPVSAARRPGESRLLTPDGHVLHINFNINGKFLRYCEQNDIVVLCLPPHSTHPLQPLGVGHFHSFRPTVAPQSSRRLLPYNNIGINRDLFFPIYK